MGVKLENLSGFRGGVFLRLTACELQPMIHANFRMRQVQDEKFATEHPMSNT